MIPHWLTDASGIAAPIAAVLFAIYKLKTKNDIRDATDTIVEKIDTIGTALKVHVAEDDGKHRAIDQHLEYTDKRVDRLETASQKG